MLTATALTWQTRGRAFVSDASGRFDVAYSDAAADWVAVDAEAGRITRHSTKEDAQGWCEEQAMEFPS